MRRAIALCTLLIVWASFPIVPRVAAQTALEVTHTDRVCGFSFSYPAGWTRRVRQQDRKVVVESPDPPETSIVALIGPIQDVRAGQVTTDQVAQSVAAHNCLFCLRGTLVWVDRFAVGAITATYIVERMNLTVGGQSIPHYVLQFFLIDDGTSRGLAPAGWTQADIRVEIPVDRFRRMESVILAIAQSLRLTVPERAQQECWPG
ncbi:MAG: hypothetical protein ACT4PY_14200 [Armatimonadota bacterium]